MATETTNQPESVIDETPISPTRERKNSLEEALKHRPEREELVNSTQSLTLI